MRAPRKSVLLASAFAGAPLVACVDAIPLEDYPDPIEVRDVDLTTPAAPEVLGRVDRSIAGQWRMSWPGSRIIARFRGTSVDGDFEELGQEPPLAEGEVTDNNRIYPFSQFDVILDGQLVSAIKLPGYPQSAQEYEFRVVSSKVRIADGLDPNVEHSVELVRRSESSVGVTTFKGFTFGGPNAGYLPGFKRHKHRLLFAGDSITAGYGNEGADFRCKFSPNTSNARLSWASVAGRYLGAESMIVAWSGKGMALNFRAGDFHTLPELFDATVGFNVNRATPTCTPNAGPGALTPCFDPKSYAPDVIVVNLGTNDSNESYCPGGAETCPETSRLQRTRDPETASTRACAAAFAACADKACGEGKACPDQLLCTAEATRCLSARPPNEAGGYLDKYTNFLKKLRVDYGQSPLIVGALGPMVSNFPNGDGPAEIKRALATYIRTAIAVSGEANVEFLPLDTHFFLETSGCDYHPSAITDRVMAKRLETLVRSKYPSW